MKLKHLESNPICVSRKLASDATTKQRHLLRPWTTALSAYFSSSIASALLRIQLSSQLRPPPPPNSNYSLPLHQTNCKDPEKTTTKFSRYGKRLHL